MAKKSKDKDSIEDQDSAKNKSSKGKDPVKVPQSEAEFDIPKRRVFSKKNDLDAKTLDCIAWRGFKNEILKKNEFTPSHRNKDGQKPIIRVSRREHRGSNVFDSNNVSEASDVCFHIINMRFLSVLMFNFQPANFESIDPEPRAKDHRDRGINNLNGNEVQEFPLQN